MYIPDGFKPVAYESQMLSSSEQNYPIHDKELFAIVYAVKKWRSGGFHLVLMDIQLPVMNGLDATREIRRLERVNSIGVFSSSPSSSVPEESTDELKDQDRLENPSLFKSPVIVVALTASSLQSDRHEALAAGCNDFLTKVSGVTNSTLSRARSRLGD